VTRDARYDILFEPVKIGPVTAKNRFYQVPHCNGMGHLHPSSTAAMRGMKAEGGWAVICTEECEIHPTTDVSPHIEERLWDDSDIPHLARMTDAVHAHGALAGIELVFQGHETPNRYSRETPMAVSNLIGGYYDPVQARAMNKSDIRDLRRWHRDAAIRAKKAGFDLVYVYAGHNLSLPMHFLSRRFNDRTDEYGGSLENRVRLLKELIIDTKEAVGDTCAVPVRLSVDELIGPDGIVSAEEGREVVEMLAELPDLWDVNVSDWSNDSITSRFGEEGSQEDYISFVKKLTTKPVVGVGRFTSPDAMVSQIKRGVLDMIGAARPSIADPFLPQKIEQGRLEDIRECIGCNICVTGDFTKTPIRCTQNPTLGEEWRKGWHPEKIAAKKSDAKVLIVGAGPAGLECARSLGNRGYGVVLAEGSKELGGRVTKESRLHGLAAWARVRDYRVGQIQQMANVDIYLDSALSADDLLEFGAEHVVLACGSSWRRDGIGRANFRTIPGADGKHVFTPDDIISGVEVSGPVVVFDDDHYYLGGIMAELLKARGLEVTLVTPAADVSTWTHNTLEQHRIQKRLLESGVNVVALHNLQNIDETSVTLSCIYTERETKLSASSVVLTTMRLPNDSLYHALVDDPAALSDAGIKSVTRIGDALAPATIAAAVYSGHRFARELDEPYDRDRPFKRELAQLGPI
jgi:dimethylamine/trimethylamine dehydrogenase